MHMEYMRTLAPNQRTIVSWHFAGGTAAFKWNAAYTTNIAVVVILVACSVIVSNVPPPLGNSMPVFDRNFH